MRCGGDAGTAIHTSVPFGIAASMASVLQCGEGIDRRRRVESHRSHKKVAPGCLPGATSGEVFGRKHADLLRESMFRFVKRPRHRRQK
jgi:hypothetical protein